MESKRAAEQSFLQPPFPVDLVETGLRQKKSLLCVAKAKSKIFIAVKLVEEVKRRSSPGKTALVLSENIEGDFVREFSRAVDLQTDLKRISLEDVRNKTASDSLDANVLVTTVQGTVDLFESNILSVEKVNLVIIDDCLIDNNILVFDCDEVYFYLPPFLSVIELLTSHDQMPQPIIIGLLSDLPVSSPENIGSMLPATELAFGCSFSVSSDLVALNRFGEQPQEKLIKCSVQADETDEKIKQIFTILMSTLSNFLLIHEESQLVRIRQQCVLCYKILGHFGCYAAICHARLIIKEISKLKKKVSELEKPHLLLCENQLQSLLQYSKKDEIPDITPLVKNIITSLSYLKHNSTLDSKTTYLSTSNKNDDTASSFKVASNINEGRHGDNPVSIILCFLDQEAMVLNLLLNTLAKTNPEMAFLRSRHISSAMIKQNDIGTDVDTDERNNEDIIRLICDGQVNVVVTSQDIERDIYLGQCKQVIRIGIPQDYLSYVRVKNIPRMSHAQFIILESEDNGNGMLQYNTFKQIEGILTTSWPSHQTVPEPDVLSLDLADCSLNGEDGPCIDANDAIALINRYCKAFPCDGFGCAVPRCREKVIKEEDQTRVVSKLYLPRHSPVFWSFKGTAIIPRKQSKRPATPEELAKARIESKTRAALLACRALLDVDEMNDQLEPTIRHTNVSLKKADEKCDGEVADGGQGVEGSAKRRRAYHKKFATVLTKNLAVAEEPVYMYSITVAVKHPARHEDTVRPYNVPSTDVSSVSLGFLSRNRLPKLPNFTLFSKAGELKISITECLGTTTLSHEQLALVKRFHQYVYAHIININGDNEEQFFRFDPEEQSFGCYLVLLIGLSMDPEPSTVKNSGDSMEEVKEGNECDDCLKEIHLQNLTLQSCKERTDDESETQGSSTEELGNTLRANTPDNAHKNRAENLTIAFEFLEDLEKQLEDFRNPQHPSVTETRNYEVFRNRVVTATYMAKPTSYFVADICYDMTPLSPFPDPSVAATFAEYYKERYDVVLREDQPLLIMDYISKKQLNLLSSRYQDTKGKDLALPDKNSKRSQRSKIKLIPQLCSIHPISASLWQQMLYIPSIMYRLECLLVAEELRHTIALETGIGSIEYPGDGLPLLATGESVGENSIEGLFEENNSERSKKEQAEVPKNRPGTSRKEETEVPKDYPGASCKEETEVPKDRPEPSRKEQAEVPKDLHGLSRKEQTAVTKNRPGPSATLFLRALTCLGACDVFSHERLEMYGDALIKHSVSLNLYHECPFSNVGQISFLRGLRVSNRQLFYLGRALDLPSYICNVPFKPLVNWHPHGFTALSCDKTQARYLELNATEQGIDLSDNEEEKSEKDEAACVKTGQEALIDGQNHVVVSDKTVADATEAIIGAYLVTCGFNDALRLMKWIGLDVRTKEPQENISYTPTTESTTEYVDEQKTSDFDEEYFDNSLRLSKESLDVEFKEIEEVLGYTFRDKLLLLQAFTHASYPRDFIHVRTSYEHLEFLGDALLDYLITRYLYYTQRTMSPGALTDLRSAVVNSYSFAFLAVKYGFHRHLRSLSPAVFRLVNKFVVVQDDMMKKKMKENPDQIFSSVFIPMDDEAGEGVEVPKVLADLFESVIGAVFIDCGQDEEKTWDVVYPLLQATLEHYSIHLPVSPVRQLQEMLPSSVSLLSMERSIAGKYTCTLLVEGVGKFKGTGRNPKIARSTAAQRALAHIQSQSGITYTKNT